MLLSVSCRVAVAKRLSGSAAGCKYPFIRSGQSRPTNAALGLEVVAPATAAALYSLHLSLGREWVQTRTVRGRPAVLY